MLRKNILIMCLLVNTSLFAQAYKSSAPNVHEEKKHYRSISQQISDSHLSGKEALLDQDVQLALIDKMEETLNYLQSTLESLSPRSQERFIIFERILFLTLEQSMYIAGEETKKYQDKWQKWMINHKKGQEPKLDQSLSRGKWQALLDQSVAILHEYPKNVHGDTIKWCQGLSKEFLGDSTGAKVVFEELIAAYPNSPYTPDAYFALGEYYFDKQNFSQARSYYQETVKNPKSKRYGWGLFKKAWCDFNLGKYQDALLGWQQAVAHAEKNTGQKLSYREETLRDMIFAFAELHQIDPAIAYYNIHGGDSYVLKFLQLLAENFSEKGEFDQASVAWRKLLQKFPHNVEAFNAQKELVQLAYNRNAYGEVWSELEKLLKNYAEDSVWAKNQPPEVVEESVKSTLHLMEYYPKLLHKRAQEENNIGLFEHARIGYILFLSSHPPKEKIPEIKQFLGDIYYNQKKYADAGRIYQELVLSGKNGTNIYTEEGKFKVNIHKESADNMLDAYTKDFAIDFEALLKTKPDFSKPPKPLSNKALHLIQGCRLFRTNYPDEHKNNKTCAIFIAEIYYRSQIKEAAQQNLLTLALQFPQDKEGLEAAETVVTISAKDQQLLFGFVKKLYPVYQKSKLGPKLKELLDGFTLEEIAREPNPAKLSVALEDFARKHPDYVEVDKLWFNAAVAYLQVNNHWKAKECLEKVIHSYPNSVSYPLALFELAKVYEKTFDLAKATEYFQKVQKLPDTKINRVGVLSKTCELSIAINYQSAIQPCSELQKKSPKDGKIFLRKWLLAAENAKDAGSIEAFIATSQLEDSDEVLAYFSLFRASSPLSTSWNKALQNISRIQSRSPQNGEFLRYVGEVLFISAKIENSNAVHLNTTNLETYQASIQSTFNSLKQMEQSYQRVFQSKDAYWGIAAFYELGSAYETFAVNLQDPPSMNGIPKEEIKKQLASSVQQLTTKAKEYYETGTKTVAQFDVISPYRGSLEDGMQRLQGKTITFDDYLPYPEIIASRISVK